MHQIERITCGNGNCYIIKQEGSAILVDTGREKYRDKILEACKAAKIKLIILTHGHVDHIQNTAFLANALNVPIAIHEADVELIKNNLLQPMSTTGLLGKILLSATNESMKRDKIEQFTPSVLLKAGYSLRAYGIDAEIIDLKGHTNGSIGIDVKNKDLIVGDGLMNLFYPTKSMLYVNKEQMIASAQKISNIGERTIHFGHGKPIKNRKW